MTIGIDAKGNGTYTGDVCAWSTDRLTIAGFNGMAHIDAAGHNAQGKATWVIAGDHTTIRDVELSGSAVPDNNGAGIRQEGAGLTVIDCYFHDNQDGILAGDNPASDIVIEDSEFARNGAGDGYSHNMYINHVRSFTLEGSWSHDARVGHLVKSRALVNHILYNRITGQDGTDSYEIDLPNGGRSDVIGNVIEHKSNETQGFSDLLDRIRAGVFVVDAHGGIIYSNKAANAIALTGDYLRASSGKLSAREPESNQLLQEAFRAAGDGDVAISNKSVAIPLTAADGTRHVANLLPLTRRRAAEIDGSATVAVFVHKAALELPNPPELIASAYKLTKTELRVLLALVELGGGPEIAEALGVGNGTVKTHLRHLFQKTGAKHQADLVKLVACFSRSMIA